MSNTKDTPIDYTPDDIDFVKDFAKCGIYHNYMHDNDELVKRLKRLNLIINALENDQSLKLELQKQKELNAELVKCLKEMVPLAEDGYVLHRRNGSHQEFLSEDKELISLAESLIKKSNEI